MRVAKCENQSHIIPKNRKISSKRKKRKYDNLGLRYKKLVSREIDSSFKALF